MAFLLTATESPGGWSEQTKKLKSSISCHHSTCHSQDHCPPRICLNTKNEKATPNKTLEGNANNADALSASPHRWRSQ